MESQALSILLVEDNPYDAELLEFQLRVHGHRDTHIEQAKRLSEALEMLERRFYDLILLDLTLPDVEGLEVFLEINKKAPDLPIVILTGLADARLALETVRHGAQDYLVKDEIEGRALLRALNHAVERKKVQQQAHHTRLEAEETQRRKSEFIAMVSHELRNPMTGIVGFIHLLGKTRLDAIQREYVESVAAGSRALVELLNNLLELSSAEAGHVSLDTQPLDLRECLEKVACFYVPQARSKGLEVVTHIDPHIPDRVLGDALRLRQVVVNLLSNALKFTDEGYVGVSARVRSSHDEEVVIRFVVEDSGRGIPEDKRKTVFQPFRQAEKEDRARGKGLGLAICQQLIQAMGGVVGVVSQPGCGTGFWFDLPFKVQAPSSLIGRLQGQRAVVAEPHGPTQLALVFVLEAMGAEVVGVSDRRELLEAVASGPCHLVVVGEPPPEGEDWAALLAEGAAPAARWLFSAYERRGKESGLEACFISRPLRLADLLAESCAFEAPSDAVAEPDAAPGLAPAPAGTPVAAVTSAPTPPAHILDPTPPAHILDPTPPAHILDPTPPAHTLDPTPPAHTMDPTPPAHIAKPPQLLVIDDDPVCRQLVVAIASLSGVVCETASSADEALIHLAAKSFQLILLDCELPDLNGLELARQLRERALISSATPIVVISGTPIDASEHDLDGALTKPIDPEQLDEVLRGWLPSPQCIDWAVLERLRKYQRGANSNLICELVETYVKSCPGRILALEKSLSDPQETRRVAHQLRGSATSVGAVVVASVAERLEIEPCQPRVVRLLQSELGRSLSEFQEFLDRPVEVSHPGST